MVALWTRLVAWLAAAMDWRPAWGTHWVEPSNEVTRAVLGRAYAQERTPAAAQTIPAARGRQDLEVRSPRAEDPRAASAAGETQDAQPRREAGRPVRAA